MSTQQQLPSHHRWDSLNSCHHNTGEVHTTTAAITIRGDVHTTIAAITVQCRICSHNNSCHHCTGDVHTHTRTAAITAQDRSKWQQLSSHHWRCSDNSCHYNTGLVHTITAAITAQCSHNNSCHHSIGVNTTTAAITTQERFTQQQLPSQQRRCSMTTDVTHTHTHTHYNSCHHNTGDVHTTTADIRAQEMSAQQLFVWHLPVSAVCRILCSNMQYNVQALSGNPTDLTVASSLYDIQYCCFPRLQSQWCVTCWCFWFPDLVSMSCCAGARCLGPK